jgi:hypothetical protein
MNLIDFTKNFIEEIRNDSIIERDTPSNIFLQQMSNRLEGMGYIFDPTILQFYKVGTSRRTMKFDLYAYDEYDKSLILLANEFSDDTSLIGLSQNEINLIASKMLNYIEEVKNGTIFTYIDPSQDAYFLATEIRDRLSIDYLVLDNDKTIDKFKLFIITNKKVSTRVSNLKLENFLNRQVELNVWDIERLYDIISSGKDKEPIQIELEKYNNNIGIPYLKANFDLNKDYDAYLCILPGKLLSDIYFEHGSRLLEGNVRAFLSTRGKVNKGIRNTIIKEPEKFFTYNNGIACTAKEIYFSDDFALITRIEDLQIINGGQTTASLTSAWKKEKAPLDKIFVPMKLTIVKSDNYDDMIQKISLYANSQNKVTDADLFSNHPFHREFERMSLRYPAPPKSGETNSTYWYYERSRGKYEQSQFKFTKKSEKIAFERKYPKRQVIKKEELGKYLMAASFQRPDLVSKGSSKNTIEFANRIDHLWKKDKNTFNEYFYQISICYAIIYKEVDHIVSHAEWYRVGGPKLNIVPYTVSKLFSLIPYGKSINTNRIWKEQTVYKSMAQELDKIAQIAYVFIENSSGILTTEYAKKEETWKSFKSISYDLSTDFINDLIDSYLIDSELNSSKKGKILDKKIEIEIEVLRLAKTENGTYWTRLLNEGNKRRIISISEDQVIRKYICELSKESPKTFPSPDQLRIAWGVRTRLEEKGVQV